MPLYQLMKKTNHFIWSQRADDAFNDLKRALSTAPILAAPTPREPMLLYIAATPRVISVMIMVERTSVVLTSPKGDKLQYVLQMHFRTSNNVAEYEALVHGLKMAKQIGIRRILSFRDSDLVTHQVSGDWDAKDANMTSYCFYVQQLSGFFEGCEFHHVPRANNEEADRLSKIGSTKQDIPAGVSLEIIHKPSIKPSPESISIYVSGDPAPAQVPPPDPGATICNIPGLEVIK
jgi:ribonuclease HI